MDLWFLSRPNAHKVQLDLFYDYRSNLAVRFDSGHMAVEDRLDEIVDAVNAFYTERVAG
jgi:hypothetical protein